MKYTFKDSRELGKMKFRSSWADCEWVDGNPTKNQKTNDDGVPIWRVRVMLEQGNGLESLRVSLPVEKDPGERLSPGDELVFVGLTLESSENVGRPGRWECFTAKKIVKPKKTEDENG